MESDTSDAKQDPTLPNRLLPTMPRRGQRRNRSRTDTPSQSSKRAKVAEEEKDSVEPRMPEIKFDDMSMEDMLKLLLIRQRKHIITTKRTLAQLGHKLDDKNNVCSFTTWSCTARDLVQSEFTRQLKQGNFVNIFMAQREPVSRALVQQLSKIYDFDKDVTPEMHGKAKSVKGYITSYLHNYFGRFTYPILLCMWRWTGLQERLLNGIEDAEGQEYDEPIDNVLIDDNLITYYHSKCFDIWNVTASCMNSLKLTFTDFLPILNALGTFFAGERDYSVLQGNFQLKCTCT